MALIKSKQIDKLIAGKIDFPVTSLSNFMTPTSSLYINLECGAATEKAGEEEARVKIVPHVDDAAQLREGFITTVHNLVEVSYENGNRLMDTDGSEVFGRIIAEPKLSPVTIAEDDAHIDISVPVWNIEIDGLGTVADQHQLIQDRINEYDIQFPIATRNEYQEAYADMLVTLQTAALAAVPQDKITIYNEVFNAHVKVHDGAVRMEYSEGVLGHDAVEWSKTLEAAMPVDKADYKTQYEAWEATWSTWHSDKSFHSIRRLGLSTNLKSKMDAMILNATLSVDDMKTAMDNYFYGYESKVEGFIKVSFWKINASGTEVSAPIKSYSAVSSHNGTSKIKMTVPYLFTFEHAPMTQVSNFGNVYIADDPASSEITFATQTLNVTALNTMDHLTLAHKAGTDSEITVNGQTFHSSLKKYAIEFGTQTVLWDSSESGFDIKVGDVVEITYQTTGVTVP